MLPKQIFSFIYSGVSFIVTVHCTHSSSAETVTEAEHTDVLKESLKDRI